jgi:hypothetical protein
MVVMLLASSYRWERAVVWLPALIIGIGLVGMVLILLGRAFMSFVREVGHPRWFIGSAVALLGIVVVLTWLGVSLPKE